jgi:hypothetical protein
VFVPGPATRLNIAGVCCAAITNCFSMRYSLLSLLLAMANAAIGAAAVATRLTALSDVHWAISYLSLFYAFILAICSNKRQRALAAGYVALGVAYLVGFYLMPDRFSAARLFTVAGYSLQEDGFLYSYNPVRNIMSRADHLVPFTTVANAAGVLVAGMIGYCIAAVAYSMPIARSVTCELLV